MSNFMNEVYYGKFGPEFSVSMLKESIALFREYLSKTRKSKAKIYRMDSVSTETVNFFFKKF